MNSSRQISAPGSRTRLGREMAKGLRSRRSSALLLVLAMIVLLSGLILAFLSSAGTELITSQTYANGATVKQLADSATQLVISQVMTATGNTNSTLAWASQPGMIRTYDTNGNPALFYKLYSSDQMITNAPPSTFATNETPPVDWDSANNAGIYTDLNSPVSSAGTNYFPIVDPRALASTTIPSQNVEGFTYTKAVDLATLPSDPGGAAGQRLPMPVRWLYVLQNGAIATPISGAAGTVNFDTTDSTKVPSTTNPIVGRIAFWTDDETCKVNINTASEGTFWDRPWANTTTEQNFATAIPAQNEFQRYPGHPAKTCLSSVFGPLGFPTPWPIPAWYFGISSATQTTYNNELAAYYGFTPRIADGGTKGGSVNEQIGSGTTSTVNGAFTPITPDGDRLYASTDELLYNPARTINTQNGTAMSNGVLEKAKFFITAHSRAPEVNLFGKPRMALWPIQADISKRNAKDALIAFCSTINSTSGAMPYYFQRSTTYTTAANIASASSQSPTLDWTGVPRNQALYSYISQLMQQNIPGFGGSFGGSPTSKYPNTYNQIITEMFDMIRSGVNGYSNGLSPSYNYAPTYLDPGEGQVVPLMPNSGPGAGTHGFGRFVTVTGATIVFYRSNASAFTADPATGAVPTDPNLKTPLNPSGVVLNSGAQIGAVLILNPFTASPGFPPWSPNVTYTVTGLDQFKITSPSLGPPALPGSFRSLGFLPSVSNTVNSRAEYSGAANCTPFFNVVSSFRYAGAGGDISKTQPTGSPDPIKQYPFMTPTSTGTGVPLAASDNTFDFNSDPDGSGATPGHTITISIFAGADTAQTKAIQTIKMTFPAVRGLLVPTTFPGVTSYQYLNTSGQPSRFTEGASATVSLNKADRLRMIMYTATPTPSNSPATVVPLGNDSSHNSVKYYMEDIARSVEADGFSAPGGNPAQGDYRVFAALSSVPSNYFRASPGYDVTTPANIPTYPGLPNGYQTYTNAQTLRDQGSDGGPAGGFGCDNAMPGGYYPHYPTVPGGVANGNAAAAHVFASTIATGTLIPPSQLAQYGGTSGSGSTANDREYRASAHPAVPSGLGWTGNGTELGAPSYPGYPISSASATINGNSSIPGDFDNLTGLMEDGPFINKPDEGNSATASNTANAENLSVYTGGTVDITGGYFTTGFGASVADYQAESGQTFSPSRQISSAVIFGSLPTGIVPTSIDPAGASVKPWQTLLFCANPAAGSNHPGFGKPASGASGPSASAPYTTPPDHLLLDLFTMPVVEPYAISEPLSTAGKINMNYQIMPFTYIQRDTGIRAVLKSARIMAIPQSVSTVTGASASYKDGTRCSYEMRYNVNPGTEAASPRLSDGTLMGFENRFNSGDIFRCASEICDILLVPQLLPVLSTTVSYPPGISAPPTTYAATAAWWNNFLLTGDNTREFPYGDLYGRLTTKSNTYTVHVRVQALKKVTGASGTSPTQWVEGRDLVAGEYRGSSLIERYVDTSDTSLPDFSAAGQPSVEGFYKMRLVSSKKFEP